MEHIGNLEREMPAFQPEQVSSSQMRLNPLVAEKTGIRQYSDFKHLWACNQPSSLTLATVRPEKLDTSPDTTNGQNNFQQNMLNWLTEGKLIFLAHEFATRPEKFEEEHQDILKAGVERIEAQNRWDELVAKLKSGNSN